MKRFLAGLTILSVTFTQVCPAWALRNMGADNPAVPAAIKAGLEERDVTAAVVRTAPASGELWVPFDAGFPGGDLGATLENADPIPGLTGGTFVIQGVAASDGTFARIFPTPVTIDGDSAAQVFDVVERGRRAGPGALSDLEVLIYEQVVDAAAEQNPRRLTALLEKEVRAGRGANAAIFAAALRELGCFCGHFSYPGTQKLDYKPIHDLRTLEVKNLQDLLSLVDSHGLTRNLESPNLYIAEPDDFKPETTSVQVRLRPVIAGVAGHPGNWIDLEGSEQPLLTSYRETEAKVKDLQNHYRAKKSPGNRRQLDDARAELQTKRRELLSVVAKRIHGGQAVFRNHILEDYLSNESGLRRFYDIAWGFKRFDQFLRVVKTPALQAQLKAFAGQLRERIAHEEQAVNQSRSNQTVRSAADLSVMRYRLRILKDIAWSIDREVLGLVAEISELVRDPNTEEELSQAQVAQLPETTIRELYGLQLTFRAMDRRMETRGRDSLGVVTLFTFANQEAFEGFQSSLGDNAQEMAERLKISDSLNGSITLRQGAGPDGKEDPSKPVTVGFLFKTAMLVGRLGDNARALRGAMAKDRIFQKIIRLVVSTKLIHTRWASAGIISEENAHPQGNKGVYTIQVNQQTQTVEMVMKISPNKIAPRYGRSGNIFAVLNGDIDNYRRWILQGTQFFPDLRGEYESRPLEEGAVERTISGNITTDAKIIPLVIEEFLARGLSLEDAVREAVSRLAGSFAIQVVSDLEPNKVIVARGGDGQGLYVGISPDGFIPASEQLGFVDSTQRFVKVDPGYMVVIDRTLVPTVENLKRINFKTGEVKPVSEDEVDVTESTTRDVDLGDNPYFFVKEVFESPEMFETTIEGRINVETTPQGKRAQVTLDESQAPQDLITQLTNGKFKKILISGMGTANAAALAGAPIMERHLRKAGFKGEIEGVLATELGKFQMAPDMSDTLIVAVTQSGATKDLNSALEKAVKRGATVSAVVNKRDSDVVFLARDSGGGVYYTGTGRETEVAVASTKAFYAQVGALSVLGMGLAQVLGLLADDENLVADAQELLATAGKMAEFLKDIPRGVPDERTDSSGRAAALAHPLVQAARFWPLRKGEKAIVGDGIAYEAAEEARIKVSELTYMAVGRDYVTHPKHINLSAEPWMLVLAANIKGDDGGWFRDYLLNQMENYVAHKAAPVVIATAEEIRQHLLQANGQSRFSVKWTTPDGQAQSRPVDLIEVPKAPEHFAPIYQAMASHLLAYHTALAINELSVMVGQGREQVVSAWEARAAQGILGDEIVHDNTFHAAVRGAFQPFWDVLDSGVILPGIRPGLLKRFIDMTHVLAGEGRYESIVNYGGKAVPFLGAFSSYTERVRSELARGIDAIRHQAKFVTVGVETEGKVVVQEFEQFAAELSERGFAPEVIGTALGLYATYLQDKGPHVEVIADPYDGKRASQAVVVMTDRSGILQRVSEAINEKGASVVGDVEAVHLGPVLVQIYRLDKPFKDLEDRAQAGMEERSPSALSTRILDKLYLSELGVIGEVGNWLVTENGALIGKPGTSIGVNLANIHPSAVLEIGARLVGTGTVVEAGAVIGKGSYLENSKVRKNARVGAGSVLIYKSKDTEYWRLSNEQTPYVAGSVPTEIGENARVAEGTYLFNFAVGKDSIWNRFETYPNIGMHGQLGERVRATTAKIVLAKVADDSLVGNFKGEFEDGEVTGPIEVTDFVGRPGQKLGQAGRLSPDFYVEYVEGFSLPPLLMEGIQPNGERRLRTLDFMSTPIVFGNRAIALEFSGTLQPGQTKITRITGKEDSAHGILAFGFGGVLGAGSKMIGVPDAWTREGVATPADIYNRSSRTYLGHFAVLAPPGFSYVSALRWDQERTAEGEGWARFGNFSMRGGLTARLEVPAWVLEHGVDVILTQMADEFLRLQSNKSWDEGDIRKEFNAFIQNAIQSELMDLRAERGQLDRELAQLKSAPRRDEKRMGQVADRQTIVAEGIHQFIEHANSGAWQGEWRIRGEDNQPAFGSWWKEGGRWVNHDQNYKGDPEQFTLEQLVAPVPGHEHPRQEWTPPLTQGDWEAILSLFAKPGVGSISPQATVEGIVHPSAVIEGGAKIAEGAVIGPGAVIEADAVVEEGASVFYSQVGAGARVEAKARLYGVVVAPKAVAGRESHLRLSLLGSEGESFPSSVGKNTVVTLSKVMDGSTVGEGNTITGSMVVQGLHGAHASHLGNENEVIYGRLESVDAGNNNTLNSQIRNAHLRNNVRDDHLPTVLEHEIVEPVVILLKDGRSAELDLPITHGAYVAVQGTESQPVRVAGSFLGGLTVIQPGARVERSFAKGGVAPKEELFFSFSSGPGFENTELAGTLDRSKPQFVFRFMLSYPLKGTPDGQRWAVGYLVEDAAVKTVRQVVDGLNSVGAPLNPETLSAIDRLLQIVGPADLEEGPAPSAVRIERGQLVQRILGKVNGRLRQEPSERYTRTKQFLLGLRHSVEALDGRWRLRYNAADKALEFTEGVWEYEYSIDLITLREVGQYVWVPAQESPASWVEAVTAPSASPTAGLLQRTPAAEAVASVVPSVEQFQPLVTKALRFVELPTDDTGGSLLREILAAYGQFKTTDRPQIVVFEHPSGKPDQSVLAAIFWHDFNVDSAVVTAMGRDAKYRSTGSQVLGGVELVVLNNENKGTRDLADPKKAIQGKIFRAILGGIPPQSFVDAIASHQAQMPTVELPLVTIHGAYIGLQHGGPAVVHTSDNVPDKENTAAISVIALDEEFPNLAQTVRRIMADVADEQSPKVNLQVVDYKTGIPMALDVVYRNPDKPSHKRARIVRFVVDANDGSKVVSDIYYALEDFVRPKPAAPPTGASTSVTAPRKIPPAPAAPEFPGLLRPHRDVVDQLIRWYGANQRVEFRLLPGSTSDQTIVVISGSSQAPGILEILTGTMSQSGIPLSNAGIYKAGRVDIAYVIVNVSKAELQKQHAQGDEKLPGASVESVLAGRIAAHFPSPEQIEFQDWLSRQNRNEAEIEWLANLYHYYHGLPRVAVKEVPESGGGEMAVVGLTPYAPPISVSESDFARAVEVRIQSLASGAGIPPVQNAAPLTTFVRTYEFPHPMVVVQLTFHMSRGRLFNLGIPGAVEDVLAQLSAPSVVSKGGLEEGVWEQGLTLEQAIVRIPAIVAADPDIREVTFNTFQGGLAVERFPASGAERLGLNTTGSTRLVLEASPAGLVDLQVSIRTIGDGGKQLDVTPYFPSGLVEPASGLEEAPIADVASELQTGLKDFQIPATVSTTVTVVDLTVDENGRTNPAAALMAPYLPAGTVVIVHSMDDLLTAEQLAGPNHPTQAAVVVMGQDNLATALFQAMIKLPEGVQGVRILSGRTATEIQSALSALGGVGLPITIVAPSAPAAMLDALGVDEGTRTAFLALFQRAQDNWQGLVEYL